MYGEGYVWEFTIYEKNDVVFHYSCGWNPEFSIDDEQVNMDILERIVNDPVKVSQFDALLHPGIPAGTK